MTSSLIKALQIFLKYGDIQRPTICEHDMLYVMYDPSDISVEDKYELANLGFMPYTPLGCFRSYVYGS